MVWIISLINIAALLGIILIFLKLIKQMRQSFERDMQAKQELINETVKNLVLESATKAYSQTSELLLKLAEERLGKEIVAGKAEFEKRKEVIDETVKNIKEVLGKMEKQMQTVESERKQHYGSLEAQLKTFNERTTELHQTTAHLKEALAGTKSRGQWGERMAEDILQGIGMIEGVNYFKQEAIASGRPDYTFVLPQDKRLNMDVKFPFDNYLKYLDAINETEKENYAKSFIRDVKNQIKEVSTREYINQDTVDLVILFIPSEAIYRTIFELEKSVLDDAFQNKVLICSPITLFGVLLIIRQAVENFSISQTAGAVLSLLGQFKNRWKKFYESFGKLGERIEATQKEYENVSGIRSRQLDHVLNQIETLSSQKALPQPADEEIHIREGLALEEN